MQKAFVGEGSWKIVAGSFQVKPFFILSRLLHASASRLPGLGACRGVWRGRRGDHQTPPAIYFQQRGALEDGTSGRITPSNTILRNQRTTNRPTYIGLVLGAALSMINNANRQRRGEICLPLSVRRLTGSCLVRKCLPVCVCVLYVCFVFVSYPMFYGSVFCPPSQWARWA